jgi:hypothetical protein
MSIIQYTNQDPKVFCGFYETELYDSDSLINLFYGSTVPENYEVDFTSFRDYMNAIGKLYTDELESELLKSDIVDRFDFVGIKSPAFYNFETDKLIIRADVDLRRLKQFVFQEHREEFGQYLKEHYTTRDGFFSFMENNVADFQERLAVLMDESARYPEYESAHIEADLHLSIMLDFLIISEVDLDSVMDTVLDRKTEIMYQYTCLSKYTRDKGFEYFSYTYDDDGETILVGDRIETR